MNNKYKEIDLHEALNMKIAGDDVYRKGSEEYCLVECIFHTNQYYKKLEPVVLYMNVFADGDSYTYPSYNSAKEGALGTSKYKEIATPVYVIKVVDYDK